MPGLMHDPLVRPGQHPGSVGAENPRLRNGREALANPDVEVVERRRAQLDENLAVARLRVGNLLVAQHVGTAVLMDPDRLHGTILA